MGVLREVVEGDLQTFHEFECEEEAAMAAFPSRDPDAFMARWAKTLANDADLTMTIVAVLEKCRFVQVGEHRDDEGVQELLLELRSPHAG